MAIDLPAIGEANWGPKLNAALTELSDVGTDAEDSAAAAAQSAAAAASVLGTTGTYAARPAASSVPAGALYYATDIPEVYRSNGAAWSVVGSAGNELGFAAMTSSFTVPVDAASGMHDLPGMSISFKMPERPVRLELGALTSVVTGTPIQDIVLRIYDVTNAAVALEVHGLPVAAAGQFSQVFGFRRITGAPGVTRTFKAVAVGQAGRTALVMGSATFPANLAAYTS